jgi:polyhydroxyalkanoate synthesis regulator phasin
MARKKTTAPATDEHASETARRIWLAGIGAYGRAFSEGQESLARLTDNAQRVFDDLVAKGEAIEKQVGKRGREVAARVAPNAAAIEDRVRKVRERLGLAVDAISLRDEIEALEARVAALENASGLGAARKSAPARKKAVKKAASRKRA